MFYKRRSDVFGDEFVRCIAEYVDEETARAVIEGDQRDALMTDRPDTIVRFYIPGKYAWRELHKRPANGDVGEFVTTAMREVARLNPELDSVLNVEDCNAKRSGPLACADLHPGSTRA